MVEELVAIAVVYGLGVCLVHIMVGRRRDEPSRLVLVTRDAGDTIEWHLRSAAFRSALEARIIDVTVLDAGSGDETLRIADRLMRSLDVPCRIVRVSNEEEAERWLSREAGIHRVVRLTAGEAEELHAAV